MARILFVQPLRRARVNFHITIKLAIDQLADAGLRNTKQLGCLGLGESAFFNDTGYAMYHLRVGQCPVRLRVANIGKAVVEEALKLLVRIRQQEEIKAWRGKLPWTGDLDAMRMDKPS